MLPQLTILPLATNYKKAPDDVLIKAILSEGKTELFGILYDRYADKVFRKCISFVKDKDAAQDMVQDILLKAFTQLSRFKGNSRFSTWLYAISYNYCVEHYRRNSKFAKTDIDSGPDIAEPDETQEEELLSARSDQLKRALDMISPEDKMLLMMKYQDDTSIKDLMAQLDISESAVKMRLARARKRVKDLIQDAEHQAWTPNYYE